MRCRRPARRAVHAVRIPARPSRPAHACRSTCKRAGGHLPASLESCTVAAVSREVEVGGDHNRRARVAQGHWIGRLGGAGRPANVEVEPTKPWPHGHHLRACGGQDSAIRRSAPSGASCQRSWGGFAVLTDGQQQDNNVPAEESPRSTCSCGLGMMLSGSCSKSSTPFRYLHTAADQSCRQSSEL